MISIEFNDDAVTATLDRARAALDDMAPLMGRIARALKESTEDRFADGVAPDGSAWAPRSPVTIAAYERKKLTYGGVLHLTGTMSRNIHASWTSDTAEVASNAEQSAFMQFGAGQGAFGRSARGGPIPWGDIPARPFLGVSEDDRAAILDIVAEALERALDP